MKRMRRLILYGAGSLGNMASDLMIYSGFYPSLIVDGVRTGVLNGIPIIGPTELSQDDKNDSLFLVCISTLSYASIRNTLFKLGCRHVAHFYFWAYDNIPHVLGNGWHLTSLTSEMEDGIFRVQNALLHDSVSTAHYMQFLWWRLRRREKIYESYPVESDNRHFYAFPIPPLTQHETYIDVGAYEGKCILDFIRKTNKEFNNIYAFEPDVNNYQQLVKSIPSTIDGRIQTFDKALSNCIGQIGFNSGLGYASKFAASSPNKVDAVTLDSLAVSPTIIKIHAEGMEMQILDGSQQTIRVHRPILMVLADHNVDGLYKIPEFIIAQKDYKLFFINHDYCGNTSVYYGIPKERVK